MWRDSSNHDTSAVSEVIGAVILIAIAVLSFAVIYSTVFPLPGPEAEAHVKINGYVSNNGSIILEHIGGESINTYRITIHDPNGSLIGSTTYTDEPWDIGESIIPTANKLVNEEDQLYISVYEQKNNEEVRIFHGLLQGNPEIVEIDHPLHAPLFISSLLSNTTDEDLICFNKTEAGAALNDSFTATGFVYNWLVNSNPLSCLLYACNIQNDSQIIDYSTNAHHGTILGATWTSQGKISSGYQFDGDDAISIPYCFSEEDIDELTVEAWIKTTEDAGTIVCYNESKYFDLRIANGYIHWVTTTSTTSIDTIGTTQINDDTWHLITATYNYDTGEPGLFVDGIPDATILETSPGQTLGVGSPCSGYIGKNTNPLIIPSYETVFADDFQDNLGWTVEDSPGLTDGTWDRGNPVNDNRGDPPSDSDGSGSCYLTDNTRGNSDVDGGATSLISPTFDLSEYQACNVSYAIWYTNNEGSNPNSDIFTIYISNNNGSSWITLDTIGPSTPWPRQWYNYTFQIQDYVTLTDQIKFKFEAEDEGYGSIVEAGVDAFILTGLPNEGGGYFQGTIDEITIYQRSLSEEQIYQNYLCKKDGASSLSVIVAEETTDADNWQCQVIPTNTTMNASLVESSLLTIIEYGGG